MNVTIITPVYEDLDSLSILLDEIKTNYGSNYQVIIIDDGSEINKITSDILTSRSLRGDILYLKRNVGHQQAICVGLQHFLGKTERADYAVVMDCDGEDNPKNITNLIEELNEKGCDVVVASRKKRNESLAFRFFYKIYKLFFSILTGRSIDFGNFFAIKREGVEKLIEYPEVSMHIAGTLLKSKIPLIHLPLDRATRYSGQSKMNFQSLILHGFKAFMVFAEDSLVRVGSFCAFIVLLIALLATTIFSLKFIGLSSPGWFSISLGILTLILIQTGTLTLMMLMLTGVVKSNEQVKKFDRLIRRIDSHQ